MKKFNLFLFSLFLAISLSACNNKQDGAASSAPTGLTEIAASGKTFRILAGSELKDVAELVTAFGKTQNVNVQFEYSGTLDAVDKLTEKANVDAVWVSHGKYLQLVPAVKSQIKATEKTMYSRVVLGVKPEVVKALGWESGKTGWKDVVQAAKARKFRFAMTNPTGSNTGFVALAGLAAELSGKGDALEEKDIPVEALTEFFGGQSMTAGSSGTLAELFAANPTRVDGMINYESLIRTSNAKGVPLQMIIPKEGVITADYPLMLLTGSTQGDFYSKLIAYLRQDATQQQIASTTFRTPLSGSGSNEVVNELPFPGSLTVVDTILRGFLNRYSVPASSYFVLDVSGSMQGERLESMKQAMLSLAEGDSTSAGRFSLFRSREHIEMMPFSHEPLGNNVYDLTEDAGKNKQILNNMASDINQLTVGGGTAIFSSVAKVYPEAQKVLAEGTRRVTIVLLTDGKNTNGISLDAFKSFVEKQGEPKVPVFAILYGDANQSEMQALANSTGGRVFDARSIKLTRIMKDIRTFQ